MKFGVVVIILVFGQTLATKDEDFERVRKPCMEQNNITEDEYTAFAKDMDPEGIDEKFKCFAHCVADEMGYLDEAGKVNVKKLEEEAEMTEDVMAKVMECRAKHDMEDKPCEYIYQISTCVMGLMLKELDVN